MESSFYSQKIYRFNEEYTLTFSYSRLKFRKIMI